MKAWPQRLIAAGIGALFFWCAGFGLTTRLGYDDIMNTTFAWEPPLQELAVALVVPFTGFYRPTGSAVYRLVFDVFGLNPLPFRLVVYGLLVLNLCLVYRLAERLSGCREIAVCSTLLYTFHGRLSGIYLNNGTLYDVLCASLVLSPLNYYVAIRRRDCFLSPWQWIAFLLLFIGAINAKEMAASVPLLLVAYEAIYHRPRWWMPRNCLPALICGVLTALAAWSKMGEASRMHGNPAYAMSFTLAHFLAHWRSLMTDLVYVKGRGLSTSQMLSIWAFVIAAGVAIRRKYMWFFICFAMLGPLPVIFVPFRGFFVMYLPLAGWAMVVAALMVSGRNRLWAVLGKGAALMRRWSPSTITCSITKVTSWWFGLGVVPPRQPKGFSNHGETDPTAFT